MRRGKQPVPAWAAALHDLARGIAVHGAALDRPLSRCYSALERLAKVPQGATDLRRRAAAEAAEVTARMLDLSGVQTTVQTEAGKVMSLALHLAARLPADARPETSRAARALEQAAASCEPSAVIAALEQGREVVRAAPAALAKGGTGQALEGEVLGALRDLAGLMETTQDRLREAVAALRLSLSVLADVGGEPLQAEARTEAGRFLEYLLRPSSS